jgi:SAM-dependent methyltransferase
MDQHSGTGPGEITPDGCAVEFYALLPAMGEPQIVHEAIPPGASLLELGCGTGRLLAPLAGLGHPVTGVDESAAMLAKANGLPTVCAPIEGLRLDRTFDAVLLASTMINSEPALRQAFLDTCRRHVANDGVVVFQMNPPGWFEAELPPAREADGIRRVIQSAHRDGPCLQMEVAYYVGDRTWTHEWRSYRVDDDDLVAELCAAGLTMERWLTDDHSWFTARPMTW